MRAQGRAYRVEKPVALLYPLHDEGGCMGSIMPATGGKAICCSCKAVYEPSAAKEAQMLAAHAAAGLTEPIDVGRPCGALAMPAHLSPGERKTLASCAAGRGARLLPAKVAGLVSIGLVKEWTENDGPGNTPKLHRIHTDDGARLLRLIEAEDAQAKVEHVDMFAPLGGLSVVAPMRVDLIQQTARAPRAKKK
jgi:hypothetical protein